jgi:hypothetical protein
MSSRKAALTPTFRGPVSSSLPQSHSTVKRWFEGMFPIGKTAIAPDSTERHVARKCWRGFPKVQCFLERTGLKRSKGWMLKSSGQSFLISALWKNTVHVHTQNNRRRHISCCTRKELGGCISYIEGHNSYCLNPRVLASFDGLGSVWLI